MSGSNAGLILLAALGLATMLLATFRRLHDVRLYSRIYEQASVTTFQQGTSLSEKTARLNMLREVVDFVEYSWPELVGSIISFLGILMFLAALSVPVFVGALVMAALVMAIYAVTTRRTMRYNRGYNDEYERQVDVIGRNSSALTRRHIGLLNHWMIKLSDVDAVNYAFSLSLMVVLQVFAVVSSAGNGDDFGTLTSIILYVFEFSAIAAILPVSWQEYLRLRDILQRVRGTPS